MYINGCAVIVSGSALQEHDNNGTTLHQPITHKTYNVSCLKHKHNKSDHITSLRAIEMTVKTNTMVKSRHH